MPVALALFRQNIWTLKFWSWTLLVRYHCAQVPAHWSTDKINPTRSDLTLIHLVRQRLAQPHSYWCYRGVIEGATFGRLIYRQTPTALSHDLAAINRQGHVPGTAELS